MSAVPASNEPDLPPLLDCDLMADLSLAVLDEPVPSALHHVERHANNRVEADHGQLK